MFIHRCKIPHKKLVTPLGIEHCSGDFILIIVHRSRLYFLSLILFESFSSVFGQTIEVRCLLIGLSSTSVGLVKRQFSIENPWLRDSALQHSYSH